MPDVLSSSRMVANDVIFGGLSDSYSEIQANRPNLKLIQFLKWHFILRKMASKTIGNVIVHGYPSSFIQMQHTQ